MDESAANVLTDGSFEDGALSSWSTHMPSGTLNLTHVLSRELARSGWHAVQISNNESGSGRFERSTPCS